MKPEIKKQWVEALRSGKYRQGKQQLHDPVQNTFCCLGVLCDISKQQEKWDREYYHGCSSTLPPQIVRWAGLPDDNPKLGALFCSEHNDGMFNHAQKSFSEIADLIEKHF